PLPHVLVAWLGTDAGLRDLVDLAVVGEPLLREPELDDLDGLLEPLAGFVAGHAQRVELLWRQTPTGTDRVVAALPKDVEHRDLVRGVDGVVPGRHHDARAHVDALSTAGPEGQVLQGIRRHAVRGAEMFGRPDGVEA